MADTFSYKDWESCADDGHETRIFSCRRCGFEIRRVQSRRVVPQPPDWCPRCQHMRALDITAVEWIEGAIAKAVEKAIEQHKENEKHCKC